jgi:hypothetical protein
MNICVLCYCFKHMLIHTCTERHAPLHKCMKRQSLPINTYSYTGRSKLRPEQLRRRTSSASFHLQHQLLWQPQASDASRQQQPAHKSSVSRSSRGLVADAAEAQETAEGHTLTIPAALPIRSCSSNSYPTSFQASILGMAPPESCPMTTIVLVPKTKKEAKDT